MGDHMEKFLMDSKPSFRHLGNGIFTGFIHFILSHYKNQNHRFLAQNPYH